MKQTALAVGILFLATGATGAAASDTSRLSDPYQIYGKTREAWIAQRYPDYLAYTIVVRINERGVEKMKHYHAVYDSRSDKVHVSAVSDEEHARPPVPEGVTIHLQPKRQNRVIMDKRVGNPGEAVDYLGIPMLAPNYSFGLGVPLGTDSQQSDDLVAQIRQEFHDPSPAPNVRAEDPNAPLKSIASVTAIAHVYQISLAGFESVGGQQCYHLMLQPARDPKRYRLRQLWIDTQSYQTRQLVVASNFTSSAVPWLVTFANIGNAEYIASETAQAPVGVGDHRYQSATVSFEEIMPTERPTTFFDSFMTSENIMSEPQQ